MKQGPPLSAPLQGSVCPHCGRTNQVETHEALQYRCRLCGKPRVLVKESAVDDNASAVDLERAYKAHRRWLVFRVLSLVLGIPGALSFLATLGLLIAITPAVGWWLFWLVLSGFPLILGLWSAGKASGAAKQREATLDSAWSRVAHDLIKESGVGLSAAQIAERLRIELSQAEDLLTRLSVDDRARSEITEDGEIVYVSTQRPRLRVDSGEATFEEQLEEAQEAQRLKRS